MYRLLSRILLICLATALVFAFIIIQPPSQSTESAVVFSNMPGDFGGHSTVNELAAATVVFDVPVGPNYRINSLQTVMGFYAPVPFITRSVTVRIHADDDGALGAVVVDLGTQDVPDGGDVTMIFTPTGSATLQNGGRYWLVVSTPTGRGIDWYRVMRFPTGLFNYVKTGWVSSHGSFIPGFPLSKPSTYIIILDADPTDGSEDGRQNLIEDEPYQTAAVYCQADGAIDVYGITDGQGWLAIRVSQAEIDAVGIPAENTLIEASEDGTIRLYRLSTGEFQVNSPIWDEVRGNLPDGYVFIWDGCE